MQFMLHCTPHVSNLANVTIICAFKTITAFGVLHYLRNVTFASTVHKAASELSGTLLMVLISATSRSRERQNTELLRHQHFMHLTVRSNKCCLTLCTLIMRSNKCCLTLCSLIMRSNKCCLTLCSIIIRSNKCCLTLFNLIMRSKKRITLYIIKLRSNKCCLTLCNPTMRSNKCCLKLHKLIMRSNTCC
jgi:hypothetical protein